ncbi:MAG TPA: hypothetical protein VMW33_10095 [Ilumatobacteraceae bacterium]|jgi:hypothetical protein|nr:hypothetical protein [Ilumatobacteraceae bacterium]
MKFLRGLAALMLAGSVSAFAGCGGSDGDSVGDDGQVPVVGTSTFVREDADSTQTQAGDVVEARGLVWVYEQVMSDDRVSGTSTVTINYDMYPNGIADMWGTTVLTNDSGAWEGEWVGSIRSDGTHITFERLTGTGDYAGLRYSYFTVFGDPDGQFPEEQPALSGWIEPATQT